MIRDAFETVKEITREPDKRAKELKKQGWKVIGYPCPSAPPEMITAAGMLPYRLRGNPESTIVKADSCFELNFCPWVRNWLERALNGEYEWLDGVVMSHSCDAVQRCYGVWREETNPAFSHMVNLPHATTPQGRQFFRQELEVYRKQLEKYSGVEITSERLAAAIAAWEELRTEVKKLYGLRKKQPPLISGLEVNEILNAISGMPVEEGIALLKEINSAVRKRQPGEARPRLLVSGGILDNGVMTGLVEELGAWVVTDDNCIGTRSFFPRGKTSGDPLEDLVSFWLDGFQCPRTYRGDTNDRFKHLVNLAREYQVDGAIIYVYSFCDAHMFDVPDLRDYLDSLGIPSLYLEGDYSKRAMAQMRTRIEAFLEIVGKKR